MPDFTYSLASDLHYDFPQHKIRDWPNHQIIVAGDCGNGLVGIKPLNKLKNKGHKVFAVDGNHEHYANISQGRTILETEVAFYDGLDQEQVVTLENGLTIIGLNGWYVVQNEAAWLAYMNDGRCVGRASEVNQNAHDDALMLDETLNVINGPAIIVTHTAPTQHTLNPRFAGHYSNEWYWNPMLGEVMRKHRDKILAWNHGHTHAAADEIVDGVRVTCNPRGYPGENPGWSPKEITVSW